MSEKFRKIKHEAAKKHQGPDAKGPCHKKFTTVEHAQALLIDDYGRFLPAEDVCKVCRQPFTHEQKVALLTAAMEKQRSDD